MNSTNSTIEGSQELSVITTPVTFFISGLCFEHCLCGILALTPYMQNCCRPSSQHTQTPTLYYLIYVLNICALLYQIFVTICWFPQFLMTEASCLSMNFINCLLWHFFFTSFDAFILWKSWIVTDKSRIFFWIAVVCILYRIIWGIIDLVWSGGRWDSDIGCYYEQNNVSAVYYTIGEATCDIVATIGALYMFCKPENRLVTFQSMWFQLAKENVLRSLASLIICGIVIYLETSSSVNYQILYIAYTAQVYIYTRLANTEIVYKRQRQSLHSSSLKGRSSADH
ncbi:hypothetical protein BDR26DRAFT_849810 [Obelidium mucronatum]|nr:hypothetical protein BDR26DRAFT_849810 [Obelidium mucronatum]